MMILREMGVGGWGFQGTDMVFIWLIIKNGKVLEVTRYLCLKNPNISTDDHGSTYYRMSASVYGSNDVQKYSLSVFCSSC